jgi:hypothetical protein
MNIAAAQAIREREHDRRANAEASIWRVPPTPQTPAGGWLGWSPVVEKNMFPRKHVSMGVLRQRLAAQRERDRLAAEPRVRPPADATWRPTPTPRENALKAADPAAITMPKLWDLSLVDPNSFDPSQPPSELPAAPVNTLPPAVVVLTDLAVGSQLAGQLGTWTGSPTYARQWRRDGVDIAGATAAGYTLATADISAMIDFGVTATNAGGSTTADSDDVGPITATRGRKASADFASGKIR